MKRLTKSKSETNFFFDKDNLDSIQTNLRKFQPEIIKKQEGRKNLTKAHTLQHRSSTKSILLDRDFLLIFSSKKRFESNRENKS